MRFPALFYLIPLVTLLACDSLDSGSENQGIVEYDVAYLKNNTSIPTNLLPKKVTLKFKGNKSVTSIEGFMGMFSLCNITDLKKRNNTLIMKVMDSKYYTPGSKNDPPIFFDGLNDMKIKFVEGHKVFAGIDCKKAEVSFKNSSKESYDVYYSDLIKIKNPNKTNPYNEINGVLMQFNLTLHNVEMRLSAKKYCEGKISDDIFKIPQDYKKIPKEKMMAIISKLLE